MIFCYLFSEGGKTLITKDLKKHSRIKSSDIKMVYSFLVLSFPHITLV